MTSVTYANSLLNALRKFKCVPFKYKTINGSIRYAYGTLNPKALNKKVGKGNGSKQTISNPTDCITYWDLSVGNWRRLRAENLVWWI